ncbi:MAG: hypothetical protein AB7F64_09720 [Gammaproteobacteria bacterium]
MIHQNVQLKEELRTIFKNCLSDHSVIEMLLEHVSWQTISIIVLRKLIRELSSAPGIFQAKLNQREEVLYTAWARYLESFIKQNEVVNDDFSSSVTLSEVPTSFSSGIRSRSQSPDVQNHSSSSSSSSASGNSCYKGIR